MKTYVLYNGLAGNGTGKEKSEELLSVWKDRDLIFSDITEIISYETFFKDITDEDIVVLCGGDGTLNRFVNDTQDLTYPCPIYFAPAGTGNDFWRDINRDKYGEDEPKDIPFVAGKDEPQDITKYLSDLPVVTVKGKSYRFINGVGYGIDGYCCEVADQIRATGNSDINYTSIAIKGLLFHFKPALAKVSVDGKNYEFKGTWIAPTMKGRYYGGGMKAVPDQNRLDPEGKVTLMIMGGSGRIPTLIAFPGIFKGKHVKNKMVKLFPGKEITVSFDHPVALQIDGETVLDVESYTVKAGK